MADFSKLLSKFGPKVVEETSAHSDEMAKIGAEVSRLIEGGVPKEEAIRQVIMTRPKAPPVSSYVGSETNLGPRGPKSFEMIPDKTGTMLENPGLPATRDPKYLSNIEPENINYGPQTRDVTPNVITPEYNQPKLSYFEQPKLNEVTIPDSSTSSMDASELFNKTEDLGSIPKPIESSPSFLSKMGSSIKNNKIKSGFLGAAGAGALLNYLNNPDQKEPIMSEGKPVDIPKTEEKPPKETSPDFNISGKSMSKIGNSGGNSNRGSNVDSSKMTINAGNYQTLGTQDELKKALQESKDQQMAASIGKIGQELAGHISQVGPGDTSYWDEAKKNASRPLEEHEMLVANEKNDPNSGLSNFYRETLGSMGIKVSGNPSASALEKQIPGIEKMMALKENIAARKDIANARNQEMALRREELNASRGDKETVKRFDDLNKRIVSETASGRTVMGKAANIIRSSEAIENLIGQYNGDLSKLDSRQIVELARSLDSILSQGNATVSGTAKLIPHTMSGDVAKIAEYLTNKRQGSGQKDFVNTMVHTVTREKELAQEQIKKAQNKILGSYMDLEKKDPEKFDNIMKQNGLRTYDSPKQEPTKTFPLQVRKDGHIATVKNEKELHEAISEGWN